jgi:ubiquinone/menaquinone biosynthesis C-methylase UbiE
MATTDSTFSGSIPDIYDDHLVPLIFEVYAADLASRVAALRPAQVLETAAGSGVVARALAPRLAGDARYVVTDLNPPMLERARRRQAPGLGIEWQPADALALPFGAGGFDIVLCQFGVMFFPDRRAGFAEARRVLRPGGTFVFSTWDRIEDNEFADEVVTAAGALFPEDPPRFLARTPHGYHDRDQIAADLRAAGFRDIEIETVAEVSRAATPFSPALAYCQGTPMRNELEARRADLERVTASAADGIAARFGAGPVEGRIQAHVVTARSP